MCESGLTSDVFKFHLKKLILTSLVIRDETKHYQLTARGKEFAHNLDEAYGKLQKQPKLSVVLLVERLKHENIYLFHQRQRQPYFGFWGWPSGPVGWGESFEEAGARELRKQAGLNADFKVHAFCRQIDHTDSGQLLEDKLFVVLRANNPQGTLSNSWSGGCSEWKTLNDLKTESHYFANTETLSNLKRGAYITQKIRYAPEQY